MTNDPNINRLLADRYRLVGLLGQGAMGRVYQGEDTVLGNVIVAVKFLSQTLLNEKMRLRFEREATICAHLSEKSIHIVRVRDYGVDTQNVPFYVMEYLQGESLSDIIGVAPLSLPRFFRFIRQICLGMEAAHRGIIFKGDHCSIIHRDIKPSNILVVEDPSLGELVKILDFGIAKLAQAGTPQTQSFMGTLAYCSPEQMEGKELDPRSDIYSFGVMMYEMLTGDMPIMPETNSFGGWYRAHHKAVPTPIDPNLNIPDELELLIMQCMAKEAEQRPASVAEIWRSMEFLSKQYEQNPPRTALIPIGNDHQLIDAENAAAQRPVELELYSSSGKPAQEIPIETICANERWPLDKPQRKIVFPRIIAHENYPIPSLWGMLDGEEIASRRSSTRYNQFLFIEVPHPMLLWITVLFNTAEGARWLPCYLDLKNPGSQQLTRLLAERGEYYILLFALDSPSQYRHITKAKIAEKQRYQLLQWSNQGKNLRGTNPKVSKQNLQREYEKLKGSILEKLQAVSTNSTLS